MVSVIISCIAHCTLGWPGFEVRDFNVISSLARVGMLHLKMKAEANDSWALVAAGVKKEPSAPAAAAAGVKKAKKETKVPELVCPWCKCSSKDWALETIRDVNRCELRQLNL